MCWINYNAKNGNIDNVTGISQVEKIKFFTYMLMNSVKKIMQKDIGYS